MRVAPLGSCGAVSTALAADEAHVGRGQGEPSVKEQAPCLPIAGYAFCSHHKAELQILSDPFYRRGN